MKTYLGPQAQKAIHRAIDLLFDRAKARFLGQDSRIGGKQLTIGHSLTSLYDFASQMEGVKSREEVLNGLLKIAGGYLDAHRERTKARVLREVSSFLHDAQRAGVKTDLETVLGGKMAELWGDVKKDIRRIVETESTVVRNTSIFDAIGRIGAATNREDPTVYFLVVKDNSLCPECRGLHLMPDGVTPRLWKQSEVEGGYHEKGDEFPKIGGLHPHCRCILTHLLPGYGFDSIGRVMYKTAGHNELAIQRGE